MHVDRVSAECRWYIGGVSAVYRLDLPQVQLKNSEEQKNSGKQAKDFEKGYESVVCWWCIGNISIIFWDLI